MQKMLLKPVVEHVTGLSSATIWRLQKSGEFPPWHRISARRVGLPEGQLEQWIAGKRDWQTAASA